jgi:hypothetical protein
MGKRRSLLPSQPLGRRRMLITVEDVGRAETMSNQLMQAGSSWSDAIEAAAGNLGVSRSTLLDRMRKLRKGDTKWFTPPPSEAAKVMDDPPKSIEVLLKELGYIE